MVNFINDYLLDFSAVHPLDVANRPRTKEIRSAIKAYRKTYLPMLNINWKVRLVFPMF